MSDPQGTGTTGAAPDRGGSAGMRFSIFSVVDHHPALPRDLSTLYRETLDQCVLADELGFEQFWVAEHHFHEYGAVPNPAVLLAAAAARTRRIKLGPAISVLPFRNPLLVAEDYALIDHLSGGRLVMGVGSGYLKHEFEAFRVAAEEKRQRFDEALKILKLVWSGKQLTFHGDFHHIEHVALNLAPLQQPRPPIYVAVLRAEAAYHVGKQGNLLMTMPYASVDRIEDIARLVSDFERGYGESGAPQVEDPMLVALHTHVTESDALVRERAAEAFDLHVAARLYAKSQVYDDVLESRVGLLGSVETVTERLVELHGMGVRHVLMLMNFGAIAAANVEESMRLIAAEVVPRVSQRLAQAPAA
jgi:alkanesulfonate monooxygenase SsuD/methylene tetrahydromethanopterin reductase-like flavin-dependent oxidoreductase (luciferase family)